MSRRDTRPLIQNSFADLAISTRGHDHFDHFSRKGPFLEGFWIFKGIRTPDFLWRGDPDADVVEAGALRLPTAAKIDHCCLILESGEGEHEVRPYGQGMS